MSRRQLRADIARFRQSPGDLIVDLFEAGTPLHGRPHAGLKQRTLAYYEAGSYSPDRSISASSASGTSGHARGSLVRF